MPELKFTIGLPQLKLFSRLNASMRTSTCGPHPAGNSRDSARSTFQKPGPRMLFLAVAERAGRGLRERGAVQVAGQRLLPVDVVRELVDAQAVAETVERSWPVVTVSQLPDRALTIPDTRQFDASAFSTAR